MRQIVLEERVVQRRRYFVYIGIFLLVALSYIDRINLSVAAKPIAATYGLTPVQMGFIFSAFLWTYIVCLIPLGVAVDRWGSRLVTAFCLFLWSAAGAMTGAATSYTGMFASRLALGVGEAATYPAGGRVIRLWAPASERGLASSLLNSGSYAGLAVGAPLIGWIVTVFGWRASFFVTGAIGMVLSIFWYVLYSAPEKAGWLGADERSRILSERNDKPARDAEAPASIGVLLRSPTMWGLAVSQGCAVYTSYLFVSWLPSYLSDVRHLDVLRSSVFTAVPYAVAVPLSIAFGALSDRLLQRSGTALGGRRRVVACALLGASVILLTPFITSTALLLLVFSMTLACVTTALNMLIALTGDLLVDERLAGSAISVLVLGGNSFGVAAPIVTGYIVASRIGYAGAFVVAGTLLLFGVVMVLVSTRRSIGVVDASPSLVLAAPSCG